MVAYHFVQLIFWISLATWFGGVLFITITSPVVFQTVKEYDPILPTVLSVNMEGQHTTLLAGSIMANLLAMLARVELICAGSMLVALIGQWILIDPWQYWPLHTIRSALYLAAVIIVLYDWLRVGPQIRKHRQQYIDNADNPEVANVAKDRFDSLHRESVGLLSVLLALLLGLVLLSAGLAQAGQRVAIPAANAIK